MKYVFQYIEGKGLEFAEEPVFVHLRDVEIDPQRRLQFVPWAAHLVMTISDLYRSFLRTENPQDRYEALADSNMAEEAAHSKWYLSDLRNIGMDPTIRFTDALRFIWDDATAKTRRVAYEICRLSAGLHSIHRLVMVHAIEATSRVMFEALIPAGAELEGRTGHHLVYFGSHHLDAERKHTLEDGAVRAALEQVELDETGRAQMLAIVDAVFHHFRGFTDDLFSIAQRGCGFVETVKQLQLVG